MCCAAAVAVAAVQAVDAFLKAMGLTAAEVAAQPDLADLMTAYHFIPGRHRKPLLSLLDMHSIAACCPAATGHVLSNAYPQIAWHRQM